MARVGATIATTGTAVSGNTGTGTVTAVALIGGILPKAGTWVLTCVEKISNGGRFSITDPDGNVLRNNLTMTAGSGVSTTFYLPEIGMKFTITDATDFEVNDAFNLVVTAVDKWVPFDPAGAPGYRTPKGIFMGDEIAAADLVAADVANQPILIGGAGCVIDGSQLVFDASVSSLAVSLETISVGKSVRDHLYNIGIFPEDTIDIDV